MIVRRAASVGRVERRLQPGPLTVIHVRLMSCTSLRANGTRQSNRG
jgi:hypothetical protein